MNKQWQQRRQSLIQRAQAVGSTATTVKGAGRFLVQHATNRFALQDELIRTHRVRHYGEGTGRYAWTDQRRLVSPRQSHVEVRNARLIRRYAGLVKLPRYLSDADRALVVSSKTHKDIAAFRAVPLYARAWYLTDAVKSVDRMAREIKAAVAAKGKLVESRILALDADTRYDWGRLRVHEPGECVAPHGVGCNTTGSNSDWNKRSTLRRRANYCCISPAKHGAAWAMFYVDANKQPHTVLRTRTKLKIKGEGRVYNIVTAKSEIKPWPLHIQARMLRIAAPSILRVVCDRPQNNSGNTTPTTPPIRPLAPASLMLVDAMAEQYHVQAIRTMADATSQVRQAVTALRKRRAERIIVLGEQATRVFVALEDSYEAGNCRSMSDRFATEIWQQIGATGPCAVRADVILATRNDSYTKRACAFAAIRNAIAQEISA